MSNRLRGAIAPRLAGAVLLGVATLLVPKPDPREHWAVPPRPVIVELLEHLGDADPPDPITLLLRTAFAGAL